MKPMIYAAAFSLSCLSAPVFADSTADAEYIVGQTVTRSLFEAALAAQRDLIIGATQQKMSQSGINLPDPDAFFDLLMTEFLDEFTETMKQESVKLYVETFSEQDLADLATFYKTLAGQALIAATPILISKGSEMGRIAGERAGMNAGVRLADKIEAGGLIEIEDPELLKNLIDTLRP